jgi:hypothetical protein
LESACRAVTHFLASGLATLALTVSSNSSSKAGSPASFLVAGLPTAAASTVLGQQSAQQCSSSGLQQSLLSSRAAAQAVAEPAGPAPDVSTTAGRLILYLSTTYMLFAVLFLPLLCAWRLERHLKSKYVAVWAAQTQPQQKQQQQQKLRVEAQTLTEAFGCLPDTRHHAAPTSAGGSTACPSDSSSSTSSSTPGSGVPSTAQGNERASSVVRTAPVVQPLVPPPLDLLHLLGLAAVACCLAGQLFVWVCVQFPAVPRQLKGQLLGT